ncbi:hypothetical protein Fmac_013890 [Flemingia macrophylla]|uniref:Uncharacterized protein n=1 Tax=Flemingia macrophylla TaxID=520843 RepID=A0ABD1MA97_9FABA
MERWVVIIKEKEGISGDCYRLRQRWRLSVCVWVCPLCPVLVRFLQTIRSSSVPTSLHVCLSLKNTKPDSQIFATLKPS